MDRHNGGSYYGILGIDRSSSLSDIKSAYRKLAMKWHPDRYATMPWLLEEAKQRFQQIQEAYQVLSDQRQRILYDAGLFCDEEEEDEAFMEFMGEMAILVENMRAEGKMYTMGELQNLFQDMTREFDYYDTWDFQGSRSSLQTGGNGHQNHMTGWSEFGRMGFCKTIHVSSL